MEKEFMGKEAEMGFNAVITLRTGAKIILFIRGMIYVR